MRFLILSASALCAACLGATCAIAQTGPWGQAEDQIPPYHTHVDRRHGNDHVYPDRGAVVRDVPRGAAGINYAGLSYRFAGGVWYERVGPAYLVVEPPIGVVVPRLPAFATSFDSDSKAYLYANDVFYRARPDLGGYEVVNDPADDVPEQSRDSAGTAPARMASAAPASAPEAYAAPGSVPAPTPTPAPAPAPAPAAASSQADVPSDASSIPVNPTGVAIHPRNGQSADQQAMDRYECYRFAVGRTGFDPLAANSGLPPGEVARRDSEYSQAQAGCLRGRGYTVQ